MSPERFRAMGAEVVVGGATPSELEAIEQLFATLEQTFSRFRPDSELNRVNAGAAEFVAASPTFVRVLALALDAARRTDGLVDPTLGAAIEAAGYDRDFAELAGDGPPPRPTALGSWRHVRIAGRLVFRYPGTKFDLNCVIKGLAVDAAVKAGRITKSQEDSLLSDIKTRTTDFVNGKAPRFGFRHFDGGPPRGDDTGLPGPDPGI